MTLQSIEIRSSSNDAAVHYSGSIADNVCSIGIPMDTARELSDKYIPLLLDTEDTDITCDTEASTIPWLVEHLLDMLIDPAKCGDLLLQYNLDIDDIDYIPFQTTRKVTNGNQLSTLMEPYHDTYYCIICMEHMDSNTGNGVKLKCGGPSCTFCKNCIIEWLNKSVARCPYCSHEFEMDHL